MIIKELTIEKVVYRGKGLARADGCVVFVPKALPGERVKVEITKQHKKHAEAKLIEVLEPAASRIDPVCPLYGTCPGCCYQHLRYEDEVAFKQEQLENMMERSAGLKDLTYGAPLASPRNLGYRNKIALHTRRRGKDFWVGYVGEDNRTIIDIPACPLAMPELNDLLAKLRADSTYMDSLNSDLELTLRRTDEQGALHWVRRRPSMRPGGRPPQESDKSGSDVIWLRESSPVGDLWIHRKGFSQVNPFAAPLLIDHVGTVIENLKPEFMLDLYCGVGVFAFLASQKGVPNVLGIDSNRSAIRSAKKNTAELGLSGVDFAGYDAAEGLEMALKNVAPGRLTLLVDPPRKGLPDDVTNQICKKKPSKLIYVSCAPDTLARDLKRLTAAGYAVESVQMIDLFPRTYCFETVVVMQRSR